MNSVAAVAPLGDVWRGSPAIARYRLHLRMSPDHRYLKTPYAMDLYYRDLNGAWQPLCSYLYARPEDAYAEARQTVKNYERAGLLLLHNLDEVEVSDGSRT